MLTCQQLVELITDYLEGRMRFGDRMRFMMHITMCKHCREYLRQIKTTIRLTGELPHEPIPPEARDALLQQFRNWKHSK